MLWNQLEFASHQIFGRLSSKFMITRLFFIEFYLYLYQSVALLMLRRSSFECEPIWWSVESLIRFKHRNSSVIWRSGDSIREFASKQLISSTWSQKTKYRSFKGLSIDIKTLPIQEIIVWVVGSESKSDETF